MSTHPRPPILPGRLLGGVVQLGVSTAFALAALTGCGNVSNKTDAGNQPQIDASNDTADGALADAPLADAPEAAADAAVDATQTDCLPNTVTCDTDTLITCSSTGTIESSVACPLGCFSSGTRCADLAPSNGLSAQLDTAKTAPAITLAAGATINTTDGSITGSAVGVPSEVVSASPVDIMVIEVGSLTAQDITITGDKALAIVSDGDVTIGGVVDLSAAYGVSGPGALLGQSSCKGGDGATASGESAGGGGGGFGTAGGAGGNAGGSSGGSGGGPAGTANLVPLRGGCEGGWAGGVTGTIPPDPPRNPSPGTGGGALQISSRTKITLTEGGFLLANGGSAKANTGTITILCVLYAPCGQGSGAGSGGGILLEAPQVTVAASAGLVANGGAGHCGTMNTAAAPTATATPAPGTSCTSFAGGDGAAGATGATTGTSSGGDYPAGAGGGGGAGRIRVNLASGNPFEPTAGAVVSPAASVGVAATR